MTEINFVPIKRGDQLYMCNRCGAATPVRDGHDSWHQRLNEQVTALAQVALVALDLTYPMTEAERQKIAETLRTLR